MAINDKVYKKKEKQKQKKALLRQVIRRCCLFIRLQSNYALFS